MIKFLIKKFIDDYDNTQNNNVREKYAVLSGVLGIICNIILLAVKLAVGIFMGSVAIISDAFNNLSDAGSSVVTVIGSKLSNAKADKEHPFGHGRGEYISALIVSFIIIWVGIELIKSSASKIISPKQVSFNLLLTIILIITVFIKIWMYSYNKYIGNKINSEILLATAQDSKNDVFATSAVIITAVVDSFLPFSIDGYVGIIISAFIIYSGYKIAKNTIGRLLGTQPDNKLVENIRNIILNNKSITGMHDLIIHDYGPGKVMATAHVEIPDNSNVIKIHEIIDEIETEIEKSLGVHIVIHMDPIATDCKETNDIKNFVAECVAKLNKELSIHDFRVSKDGEIINLIFDLCVPFNMTEKEREEIIKNINKKIIKRDKNFNTVIRVDSIY